jgi:hypothetical protein
MKLQLGAPRIAAHRVHSRGTRCAHTPHRCTLHVAYGCPDAPSPGAPPASPSTLARLCRLRFFFPPSAWVTDNRVDESVDTTGRVVWRTRPNRHARTSTLPCACSCSCSCSPRTLGLLGLLLLDGQRVGLRGSLRNGNIRQRMYGTNTWRAKSLTAAYKERMVLNEYRRLTHPTHPTHLIETAFGTHTRHTPCACASSWGAPRRPQRAPPPPWPPPPRGQSRTRLRP